MVQKIVSTEPRRRGRPPAYDPQVALKKATDAFWRAGYSGTSLDAITAATGMNKPSLYAAFGDKHALYLAALERYWDDTISSIRRIFSAGGTLANDLMQVYDDALNTYFSGPGRARGCFMVGTAVTEAVEDHEIRKGLLARFEALDREFEARFRSARDRGELKKNADPATLAALASATMQAIAMRARAGDTRASLRKRAELVVELLRR
jgi:AcrR family transcriptional regulator